MITKQHIPQNRAFYCIPLRCTGKGGKGACIEQERSNRRESRETAERYLTGLLSEHPNKNGETLAAIIPNTDAQSLQGLLTDMVWDEEDLNRQRVEKMVAETGEGDGVLIFDDTGSPKQGTQSVGVARQYFRHAGQGGQLTRLR